MIDLPPAVPKPCNDCPWRRNAAPGWLGPHSPEEWIEIAHSDMAVACHQTIRDETWEDAAVRQCKGLAIYRKNVWKSPRNIEDAAHDSVRDPKQVFERDAEFIEYHQLNYEKFYEKFKK